MRLLRIPGLLLISILPLAGCGYALVGRGSNIPPEVKRVYLKPFANQTARVKVDQIVTQAVADELVTRQRFTIAASAGDADAELVGEVTGFDVRPVKFDAEQRATEYEIAITAKVALQRLAPEEVLWQNDRYQFRDSFPLETGDLGFFDRETPAIESAAKKFAETMVTDLLEGF
jgi:outer membrane lipopolysaccharide assembly protein LptE/RlpB